MASLKVFTGPAEGAQVSVMSRVRDLQQAARSHETIHGNRHREQ
jgi:hypothetical protein